MSLHTLIETPALTDEDYVVLPLPAERLARLQERMELLGMNSPKPEPIETQADRERADRAVMGLVDDLLEKMK
jgi:hypothetical protein